MMTNVIYHHQFSVRACELNFRTVFLQVILVDDDDVINFTIGLDFRDLGLCR
jgi:hypothetical protein